jgi:DMSO/TMAO reductase YedYZ molybdopterin-dependent catalytic subunit
MPIPKAMEEHSLMVWAMNGEPLPNIHGGPVRLVVPGWPGSLSHKWLKKITIRDREHDGQGMTGTSYRVAIRPMVPGGKADDSNFRILESMPVRGIITSPSNGTKLPAGSRTLALRGAAWDGDHGIARVDVSNDFGATWTQARTEAPRTVSTGSAGPRACRCRPTATTSYGSGRPTPPARCSPTSRGTGTPRATGAIRCTGSRSWWADRRSR